VPELAPPFENLYSPVVAVFTDITPVVIVRNLCGQIIRLLHGHTIIAGFVRDGKKSEETEDHRQKTKDKNKKRIST